MLLWFAVVAKALIEISMLFIVGRFLLGLLAGDKKHDNFFYQMLDIAAKPVLWLTRFISPRLIVDQHIPLAAASLLLIGWAFVTKIKIDECLRVGVAACQ
jgi:hypothetical protein